MDSKQHIIIKIIIIISLVSGFYPKVSLSSFAQGETLNLAATLWSDKNLYPDRSINGRALVLKTLFPGTIGKGSPVANLAKSPPKEFVPSQNNQAEYDRLLKKVDNALNVAISTYLKNKDDIIVHKETGDLTVSNLFVLKQFLSKKLYIFNAVIYDSDNFLLGFNSKDGRVGISLELLDYLNDISPILLAQYIYYESANLSQKTIEDNFFNERILELMVNIFTKDQVERFENKLDEFLTMKLAKKQSSILEFNPKNRKAIKGQKQREKYIFTMKETVHLNGSTVGVNGDIDRDIKTFVTNDLFSENKKHGEKHLDVVDHSLDGSLLLMGTSGLKKDNLRLYMRNDQNKFILNNAWSFPYYVSAVKISEDKKFFATSSGYGNLEIFAFDEERKQTKKVNSFILSSSAKTIEFAKDSESILVITESDEVVILSLNRNEMLRETFINNFKNGAKTLEDLIKTKWVIPIDEKTVEINPPNKRVYKNLGINIAFNLDGIESFLNDFFHFERFKIDYSFESTVGSITTSSLAPVRSPDKISFAIGTSKGSVVIYKKNYLNGYLEAQTINHHKDDVIGIKFSTNGNQLMTVSRYGKIYVYNYSENGYLPKLQYNLPYSGVADKVQIRDDGNSILLVDSFNKKTIIFSFMGGDLAHTSFELASKIDKNIEFTKEEKVDYKEDFFEEIQVKFRAELFKQTLLKLLSRKKDKFFLFALDGDVGKSSYPGLSELVALQLAVIEIKNMKNSKGGPLYPNLITLRGRGSKGELMEDISLLLKENKDNSTFFFKKKNLFSNVMKSMSPRTVYVEKENIFLFAAPDNLENNIFKSLMGISWIASIEEKDIQEGSYLPVFETITLMFMLSLGVDFDVIKELNDKISQEEFNPEIYEDILEERIFTVYPKITAKDYEELRENYQLIIDIYKNA